jgi:uncharacterized protein (TIGR02271 family)
MRQVTEGDDMTQFTDDQLEGVTIQGDDGSKIGKVTDVYYDNETGKPEWVSVATGMFGSKQTLIPLAAARSNGDLLTVPFDKDRVKGAPHNDPDGELSEAEEAELFEYYGIPYGGDTVTATGGPQGEQTGGRTAGSDDVDRSGTDDAMTRSEERLHVGTESVETGRVRLRKRIVTENVTQTVPVSHEEVTLEREPISDANRGDAMSGSDFQEEETEVTLHAEQPVTSKETVPVERVSLGKRKVTDEQTVSETVRKEQIDTDSDGGARH